MAQDYYEVLGVSRDASPDEIRKAYRKLAHQYHPDKTGGDKDAEEKLKEINAAYDTLKNPEKRAQYDRFGPEAAQYGAGGGGFGGFSGFGGPGGFESAFDDIFDMFFGREGGPGGGRRRTATPGNDLEYPLKVTLWEAATGTKKKISFNRMETCSTCTGSGAEPGSTPEACNSCRGAGQVRVSQGFFSITRTCPKCKGAGRVVTNPCRDCSGRGTVKSKRELSVDLPPGVDTGSRLRIPGEGEPGMGGGPRGDLYVLVEVEPDEIFSREGNDIICEVPVSFPQAALGTTVRVPSLNGEAELKVPAGTQSGTMFRLRGLGMPDIRGYAHGDQLVKVVVETPTKLSREQKDMLQRFEELSDERSYPKYRRFMDTLKKSFGG